VGNGIQRHIDRAITETINDPLGVPGKLRAQAELSTARPLLEPVNCLVEGLQQGGVVGVERVGVHVRGDEGAPLLVAVGQVPLVRQSHHALVARSEV